MHFGGGRKSEILINRFHFPWKRNYRKVCGDLSNIIDYLFLKSM